AFTEDSKTVLIVEYDTMYRRDLATGKEAKPRKIELPKSGRDAYVEQFSPDGKLLILRSDDFVAVYDVAAGKEWHRLSVRAEYCIFSPNGSALATIESGETASKGVQIWDPATGKKLCSLAGKPAIARGGAFSHD